MTGDFREAEVRFGVFEFEGVDCVIAASKMDGEVKFGIGADNREALDDLFRRAYGTTKTELGGSTAWAPMLAPGSKGRSHD